MYAPSFEDSVLDAADSQGNLTHSQAVRLLTYHGFTLSETRADAHGEDPVKLNNLNAQVLLNWLGY